MEKNGLLKRTFGNRDRRTVFVQLTKKGEELRSQVREKMDQLHNAINENLSQTDVENLQKIVTTLQKNSSKNKKDKS
jgi:DNA-binding MarR family transcriptional regulator